MHKEFPLIVVALVDSSADMNCIQEGLIPSKYYESTIDRLTQANGDKDIYIYIYIYKIMESISKHLSS